jgi:hypothetical protein
LVTKNFEVEVLATANQHSEGRTMNACSIL